MSDLIFLYYQHQILYLMEPYVNVQLIEIENTRGGSISAVHVNMYKQAKIVEIGIEKRTQQV